MPEAVDWDLDDSIELHPTFEGPFWSLAKKEHPSSLRWLIPQASLDAIIGFENDSADRWIDFLLFGPWRSRPVAMEIDGAQHARQKGVDRARDYALTRANLDVVRSEGQRALSPSSPLLATLNEFSQPFGQAAAEQSPRRRRTLAFPAMHRFVYAVVEAVALGLLPLSASWSIEIEDPLGVVEPCAGPMLDLLAAVSDVWNLSIVPDSVILGATEWRRGKNGRFAPNLTPVPGKPTCKIVLDPDRPPHAQLPNNDGATIIIRHAYLPVALPWTEPFSSERRALNELDGNFSLLEIIAQEIYGIPEFRDGQGQAINRIMQGMESLVMLPTGGGKSLIYQLAGLLRPGLTLIVDPIISLIDDQTRRLREEGIDRALGLHAARLRNQPVEAIYAAVADADAIFVFITPERLQIRRFRARLAEGAQKRMVNLVVVDEAHSVSEWGHDFRTSYLHLTRNLKSLCRGSDQLLPPVCALTGTASPAVVRDIQRELDLDPGAEGAVQKPRSYRRDNLQFRFVRGAPRDSTALFTDVFTERLPKDLGRPFDNSYSPSGLVFVPHVNGQHGLMANKMALVSALNLTSEKVGVYSGSVPRDFVKAIAEVRNLSDRRDVAARTNQRPRRGRTYSVATDFWAGDEPEEILAGWDTYKAKSADQFLQGETPILVATKAFGMGIDKPDIRWTVHTGIPSSIEAYAQEAGRAGRDGRQSFCYLIAALPDRKAIHNILDPSEPRSPADGRRRSGGSRSQTGDLGNQLYFLDGSFPGENAEVATCLQVLAEISENDLRPEQIDIPMYHSQSRTGEPNPIEIKADPRDIMRQKALYRLSLLGVVEDYTVAFGSSAFEVSVAPVSQERLDEALIAQFQRLEPGRRTAVLQLLENAPEEFAERIKHHIRALVALIYRVIEPARIQALKEICLLATADLSPREISERIASYLGEGPLAAALPNLIADAETIDASQIIGVLDTIPIEDDWTGAAARQLEDTPGHPVALLVAGLAEAWLQRGDKAKFEADLARGLGALTDYNAVDQDIADLFRWVLRKMQTQMDGSRRDWVPGVWRALGQAFLDNEGIERIEDDVLRGSEHLEDERIAVLERRLSRVAGLKPVQDATISEVGL